MADLFDAVLGIEERYHEEGYTAGVERARQTAIADARRLGEQKGAEMAEEIGHCRGMVAAWKMLAPRFPERFSERALKAIEALENKIASFQLDNPQSPDLHEALGQVRSRFKVARSLLGEKVEISTSLMSF
eukprot:tig00000733_g3777.t1